MCCRRLRQPGRGCRAWSVTSVVIPTPPWAVHRRPHPQTRSCARRVLRWSKLPCSLTLCSVTSLPMLPLPAIPWRCFRMVAACPMPRCSRWPASLVGRRLPLWRCKAPVRHGCGSGHPGVSFPSPATPPLAPPWYWRLAGTSRLDATCSSSALVRSRSRWRRWDHPEGGRP